MKKTILIILILLSVVASVFAGGTKESADKENDKVKLDVWYSISGENGELFKSIVKSFHKTHQEIDVKLTYTGSYGESATEISNAKTDGKEPDIIITAASQLFSGEDGNYILENNDALFDYDDFEESTLDYASYNSRLASLPYAISTMVIYYNADIIKNAGIDLENNPPRTWDEFMEVALLIQKADSEISVFDTSDSVWLFKSMLYQNDNDIVINDGGKITPVFQEESGVEVAEFWKALVDKSIMPVGEHESADNRFIAEDLVFLASSSSRISKLKEKIKFEIGAIEMPYFKTQTVALGGSTCAILTKDEKKEKAALELLSYLLDEDNQTQFALKTGYLPIRKSALERDDVKAYALENPFYAAALKELSYSRAYNHFSDMGAMDAVLWLMLDDIENGNKECREALNDAASQLINVIE